jgi:hypothetical protein
MMTTSCLNLGTAEKRCDLVIVLGIAALPPVGAQQPNALVIGLVGCDHSFR